MKRASVNSMSLVALRTSQRGFTIGRNLRGAPSNQAHHESTSSGHEQQHIKQTNNSFTSSAYFCRSRPIYVSATQQHVGKTTTCLSLISGLKKRFPHSIGYIKPVGQQHVPVYSDDLAKEIRVDKDVTLLREHFNLQHIDYKDMSPVLIPKGYTKDYIDGKISHDEQFNSIINAYRNIAEKNEVLLCEGTGHCAVGSIIGASNAKVASLIGADMVLVANGGLGSCFDQLELNRVLCEHHNVNVAGVIINKVLPEKYEQTKDYMGRALQRWGIPLLGCVPDRPYLGHPALADLERIFETQMISGRKHRFRHYTVPDITLVTTSLTRFLSNLREKPTRTLYLCHATREDIVLGFLAEYQRRKRVGGPLFEAALVICGRAEKYEISRELRDMIEVHDEEVPILLSPFTTHHTMECIHAYTPKLNIHDKSRVIAAVNHYEKYINYDLLLSRTGNSLVSKRTE
mmetsp:Transcript_3691/g.7063  ORF Transcript_3691/g.7063 Transcript_3691/m.7063 type:complete len:458 (+) Transcript_3691:255-1628(+)